MEKIYILRHVKFYLHEFSFFRNFAHKQIDYEKNLRISSQGGFAVTQKKLICNSLNRYIT